MLVSIYNICVKLLFYGFIDKISNSCAQSNSYIGEYCIDTFYILFTLIISTPLSQTIDVSELILLNQKIYFEIARVWDAL